MIARLISQRPLRPGAGRVPVSHRRRRFPGLLSGDVKKGRVPAPPAGILVARLPDQPAPGPSRVRRASASTVPLRHSTRRSTASPGRLPGSLPRPALAGHRGRRCSPRRWDRRAELRRDRPGSDARAALPGGSLRPRRPRRCVPAASRVSQTQRLVYPRNRRQGLEWWEARVRRIDEGARAIRDDRLLEIELGSFLTRGRREQLLRSLASHAEIQAGNRLKRFVRRRMRRPGREPGALAPGHLGG